MLELGCLLALASCFLFVGNEGCPESGLLLRVSGLGSRGYLSSNYTQ